MVSKKTVSKHLKLENAQERPCLVNTETIIHLSVGSFSGSLNSTT